MRKVLKAIFLFTTFIFFSCSSDDDCSGEMIIDINDPASIEAAENCGLSPAEPLTLNDDSSFWIYRLQ